MGKPPVFPPFPRAASKASFLPPAVAASKPSCPATLKPPVGSFQGAPCHGRFSSSDSASRNVTTSSRSSKVKPLLATCSAVRWTSMTVPCVPSLKRSASKVRHARQVVGAGPTSSTSTAPPKVGSNQSSVASARDVTATHLAHRRSQVALERKCSTRTRRRSTGGNASVLWSKASNGIAATTQRSRRWCPNSRTPVSAGVGSGRTL